MRLLSFWVTGEAVQVIAMLQSGCQRSGFSHGRGQAFTLVTGQYVTALALGKPGKVIQNHFAFWCDLQINTLFLGKDNLRTLGHASASQSVAMRHTEVILHLPARRHEFAGFFASCRNHGRRGHAPDMLL